MNTIPDDRVNAKTPAVVHVVAVLGKDRIISYLVNGEPVWEVQTKGTFFFWKWFRQRRWTMVGKEAVIIP